MSGGSDCHGDKHKDLELGTGFGNLIVNRDAINEWTKYNFQIKIIKKED